MKKSPIFTALFAGAAIVATASPAFAAPAETTASWQTDCSSVLVNSSKDISNLVYRINGVDTKIEFKDGTKFYVLPGTATDVWVKSGNNKSGDGSGYGEHFAASNSCTTSTTYSAPTSTLEFDPIVYSGNFQ